MKYLISTNLEYFNLKYKDWNTKTQEEQQRIVNDYLQDIQEKLKSADFTSVTIFEETCTVYPCTADDIAFCVNEVIDRLKALNTTLMNENIKLEFLTNKLSEQLGAGKHYLMGVNSEDLTVEDALEAFGFGKDGLM